MTRDGVKYRHARAFVSQVLGTGSARTPVERNAGLDRHLVPRRGPRGHAASGTR